MGKYFEADDDRVPDWPEEHRCEHCGEPVWKVEAQDGEEVTLSAVPMETELMTELYGEVRRVRAVSSYVHPGAYHVSGWSLPEVVHVEGADGGWFWFSSRVRLTVDATEVLYSEHVYECKQESMKRIEGLLSAQPVNAVPTTELRAKRVQMREERERLTREGYAATLPSESGKTLEAATQLALFC